MEVTRTNFQEVLTELDDILKNASFLGIDGEFTGLNSGPDAGAFDTPAQYYAKLRAGSMDFLLVQFGLSVFTFNPQTHRYNQQSYNFYVFPQPLNRSAPDCRFMCQASCISFLASQGFDFNKLFKLGIPYLTVSEEEKLVKRLEERQRARDEVPELIPISDDDRPQIEEICTRIDEFLTSEAEELTIDKCNAFIRRLVHQEARVRWPNKLRVESKSDCTGHSLVVQRAGTKEEEEQKESVRREREKLEIRQAVGFSTLLRKIADSGKLIVGHNMLLDLCHIIHQFFGSLPESYLEFKTLLHSLFPRILDTKVICHSQQFKENIPSSNLNVLLETVSKPRFSIPIVDSVDGRSYSTLAEKCHEAGYDAYITGICFIALCNYLGSLQTPEISTVLADSSLLNPFLNKLLIARLKDFPYINIVGKDPSPSRDHVFHITFPKDWKHSDISQLFSPFGSVYVSWLSDTSAYVGLNRREQATGVIKNLCKPSALYTIQKYVEHQAALEANSNVGERKRKLSSSESVTTTKEESSESTNGLKTAQGDNGWKVATGNELRLSSEPTIPSSDPRDRSKGTRGGNNGVAGSQLDRIQVAQKVRLKGALSLPTDFRNGRKREPMVPKYTILRRDTKADPSNEVEVANVLTDDGGRLSNVVKIDDVDGSSKNDCESKLAKTKEYCSTESMTTTVLCVDRTVQTVSYSQKSVQVDECVSIKQIQRVSSPGSCSPKRSSKVSSASPSPSSSPGVRKNSKKAGKMKSADPVAASKAAPLSSHEESCLNGVRLKHSVEKNSKTDSISLNQRRRTDSLGTFFMIAGIIFLYYAVIIKTY